MMKKKTDPVEKTSRGKKSEKNDKKWRQFDTKMSYLWTAVAAATVQTRGRLEKIQIKRLCSKLKT